MYLVEDVRSGEQFALKRMAIQDRESGGIAERELELMISTFHFPCPCLCCGCVLRHTSASVS